MTIEITKISAALTKYININYGKEWSVVRIDQEANEIIVKIDGFVQDFWLIDPNGRWTYTNEEMNDMLAEEIEYLEVQYNQCKAYYDECCEDADCDDQDLEEAYSDVEYSYSLLQNARR